MRCAGCGKEMKEATTEVFCENEWVQCCSEKCGKRFKGVRVQKVGDNVWELSA